MSTHHVLVIEDDPVIAGLVTFLLEQGSYRVSAAGNASLALELLDRDPADLIVLDLMLPGMDGFTLLEKLRQHSRIPVLVLSAKGQVTDRVAALRLGADDYLSKPFDASELLARIQAILRRSDGLVPATTEGRLVAGDLELNMVDSVVRVAGGKPIYLTPTEFRLLHCMVRNPGRVLTREMLHSQVWGYDYEGGSNDVDVYIRRLRRKIEQDPARPRYVVTQRGLGYRFMANSQSVGSSD
ncbi:MAG: response regulator transcription factor [Chloroflexi bacterium]|nr:response regulator transcription factor [Chloroflexota bacterium]